MTEEWKRSDKRIMAAYESSFAIWRWLDDREYLTRTSRCAMTSLSDWSGSAYPARKWRKHINICGKSKLYMNIQSENSRIQGNSLNTKESSVTECLLVGPTSSDWSPPPAWISLRVKRVAGFPRFNGEKIYAVVKLKGGRGHRLIGIASQSSKIYVLMPMNCDQATVWKNWQTVQ